jgi:hypothetical protein
MVVGSAPTNSLNFGAALMNKIDPEEKLRSRRRDSFTSKNEGKRDRSSCKSQLLI